MPASIFEQAQLIVNLCILLGMVFGVYLFFRKPQETSERKEDILSLKIETLNKEITNLKDNHIHTLQLAITDTNTNLNRLTIQVAQLTTVVEERLPRK